MTRRPDRRARPASARPGPPRPGSTRPAPPGGAPRSSWAWAYGTVALLVLVFFYPITLGNVFVSPDSVAPAGFAKVANEALHERGVYPLWNPYHFLGMPSFGSLSFTPYVYPPDALFGFLNGTLHFPDLTWLLAHYLLLGLAMVAFLRALGAEPWAAALGGAALALTPNLVAVGAFGHGSQIMTAAYLPLLLLFLDRFIRRGSRLAVAGFAFAAAFQLLRSHVQIVFYSWIALAGYALVLAVAAFRGGRRGEGIRAVTGLAAGLALAFGMSAFLYLPVQEYSKLSIRAAGEGGGAGLQYATSWSFHPREILTFAIPSMFGFGGATYWGSMPFTDYPNYMGIVPLALAFYGAARAAGAARVYFVALSVVALLMSFGKHFQPLYSVLYYHLPFFNKFRVPVMILVLVQFATAALAALGLTAALRARAPAAKGADPGAGWMRGALLAGAGGVALLVVLNALGPTLRDLAIRSRPNFDAARAVAAVDMASTDALKGGLLLAAALAAIGLARRGRIGPRAAALLVIAVTAVDLWILDRRIMDPQVGSPRQYEQHFAETPEITFLRSDSTQFRVLPLRWDDSRLAAFGIASVLGYHPAKPRLYQAFIDTVGIESFRTIELLNVKYVLADGYMPPDTPEAVLRHDGPVKVYQILGALPRARMIHSVRPVRDDVVALAVLRTHAIDPMHELIWSEPGPPPPVAIPETRDSVRTLRYDFNEVEYFVATAAPGILLTVEQYDPDWKVTVDGRPATLHRVNYLMRGVALTAGVHRVRYAYEPRALALGIRIAIVSALLALALAISGLIPIVRARRARGRAGTASGGEAASA